MSELQWRYYNPDSPGFFSFICYEALYMNLQLLSEKIKINTLHEISNYKAHMNIIISS